MQPQASPKQSAFLNQLVDALILLELTSLTLANSNAIITSAESPYTLEIMDLLERES